jgi:hypothetical protein
MIMCVPSKFIYLFHVFFDSKVAAFEPSKARKLESSKGHCNRFVLLLSMGKVLSIGNLDARPAYLSSIQITWC